MNNNKFNILCFSVLLYSLSIGYALSQNVNVVLQQSHTQPVSAMCFTSDNNYLITGGEDKLIKIWEVKSGLLLKTLNGHRGTVLSIKCFHKGKYFASSSSDSTIKIWNLDSDEAISNINTNSNSVKNVEILPGDNTILFYVDNSLIILYDLSLNKIIKTFKDNEGRIEYATLSSDSKYIASGNSNGQLKVWDIKSGNCLKSIKVGGKILCIRYTSDNNNILFSEDSSRCIFKVNNIKWKISKLLSDVQSGNFCLSKNDKYLYISNMCYDIIENNNHLLYKDDTEFIKNQKYILSVGTWEDNETFCFSDDNSMYAYSNKHVLNSSAISIKLWYVGNYYKFLLKRDISNRTENINCLDISKNRQMIAFGGWGNRIKYCDIKHLKIYKVFSECDYPINKVEFINNNLLSVFTTYSSELGFCDTSRFINPLKYNYLVGIFGLKEDKNVYIVDSVFKGNYHYKISIVNKNNLNNTYNIKLDFKNRIKKIEILNDYTGFIILDENNSLTLWDIESNRAVVFTQKLDYEINDIKCSYTEQSFYLACSNSEIHKLDLNSFKEIKIFKDNNSVSINKLSISEDDKLIAYCDNSIKILDYDLNYLSTLYILPEYITGNRFYKYVDFKLTNDNKYVASPIQNTIHLAKTGDENEFITIIPVDSSELFVLANNNYFMSTKKAINSIGYRVNNRVFSYEQFDLQYNRPDIVLERIGLAEQEFIKAYREAYYKRLEKMNFKEEWFKEDFYLPEIEIQNKNKLYNFEANSRSVKLDISAKDEKDNNLDRINVFVNGVPIYGTNGIDLREGNIKTFKEKIEIPLNDSLNKIEVSVLNSAGVESLKDNVEVIYKGKDSPVKPIVYFLGIGVSNYQDANFNLNYAAKDIRDLNNAFEQQYQKSSTSEYKIIDTLINERATRENILNLREKLMQTKVDDEVIIYLSGHGLLSKNNDFYYATYNMDFHQPEKYGLMYDDLDKLLDSIPARKKVLFIDACNSGEVEKSINNEELKIIDSVKNDVDNIKKGFEPESYKELQGKSKLGLSNSFQLMQEIFVNLSRGNGAVVISAARGYESAFESKSFGNGNGAFTACILEGLKEKKADLNNDKVITISELKEYVLKRVEELTGSMQKPTSRQENLVYDFRIWQ